MDAVRVLLLEDDLELRRSVADVLRRRAYAVDEAGTLAEADVRLSVNSYDVAVFDRALPDGDAAELLGDVRARGCAVPVLFLSARADIHDRVRGLDAGGDDYLVKPFAMDELLARLRSLARRQGGGTDSTLSLGDVEIDLARVEATRGGRSMLLTPKEFALLVHLVRNAGRVCSRSELLEHCWDEYADPSSNVVDVRIRLLRGKLGEPPIIHTVRGAGFVAEVRG
ncbi:response regulator transcription factor [Mobilicoccus massiliensis]|uniref:response regulator transcription factor n=1 Tax=Mobilicoccus massiliensis TaxID=1522310 RepID=UPI00058C0E6A|nr:response regulator transcription factor [Mobilicoccus massiliensis]